MSRCCTFLSVALLSTVTTAQAPPPADAAASAAEMLVLPGDRTLPITMTLLPRGLKSGRDEAAFNNYRPLVLFSGEDEPLSCALRIPDPPDKIEPGQTLDIGLRCIEDFRVRPGQPGFKMYEGSRLVGEGQLRGLR
jgi:hypothetical protein